MESNLYTILGLEPTATTNDIKLAYKKLALLYHPDKNNSPCAIEKFHEIKMAYDILSDENARKSYDNMTFDKRDELYGLIKEYCTVIEPNSTFADIFTSMLNNVYAGNEHDLQADINTFNINNIFTHIISKLHANIESMQLVTHIPTPNSLINNNDDNYTLNISIKDAYQNHPQQIIYNDQKYIIYPNNPNIPNNPNNPNIPNIPNLMINIINNQLFQVINQYDIITTRTVSLYDYIYGNKLKLVHLDGEIIKFEFDSCLEIKPIFMIKDKGLLNPDNVTRGNLFVYINIEGINSTIATSTDLAYRQTIKDTLQLMFPSI